MHDLKIEVQRRNAFGNHQVVYWLLPGQTLAPDQPEDDLEKWFVPLRARAAQPGEPDELPTSC